MVIPSTPFGKSTCHTTSSATAVGSGVSNHHRIRPCDEVRNLSVLKVPAVKRRRAAMRPP
jgi:hypothetical protein